MTAYRFCRTDDMGLLVAAYEACRGPEDAEAPPLDLGRFKRLVREIDLWCSNAWWRSRVESPSESSSELSGSQRHWSMACACTDHRRKGTRAPPAHVARAKLAILGPPRLLAEVPLERAGGLRAVRGLRVERGDAADGLAARGIVASAGAESLESMTPVTLAELRDLLANDLYGRRAGAGSVTSQHSAGRGLARTGLPLAGSRRSMGALSPSNRRASGLPDPEAA